MPEMHKSETVSQRFRRSAANCHSKSGVIARMLSQIRLRKRLHREVIESSRHRGRILQGAFAAQGFCTLEMTEALAVPLRKQPNVMPRTIKIPTDI
jgi:hypothetical protein